MGSRRVSVVDPRRSRPDRKFRSAAAAGGTRGRYVRERRAARPFFFGTLLATDDDEGEPRRYRVLLANQFLNSRLGRGRDTLSCFRGVPHVFYLTFVMPLPAGSYAGTPTFHVCNGCFTASRATRTELLMDLPVGDDAPKGRVPLTIPRRDRKSSRTSPGAVFFAAHLTLNTTVRFPSLIAAP